MSLLRGGGLEGVRWYLDFGSLHDGEVCDKKGKWRHVRWASGDVGRSKCEGLNVHEWKRAFGKDRHFLRPGAWV